MKVFKEPFDPSDDCFYEVDFSKFLSPTEQITGFTLDRHPGFEVGTGPRTAVIVGSGKKVRFWPVIPEESRALSKWNKQGSVEPLTLTVTTNTSPPSKYQRTVGLRIQQQN